MAMTPEEKNARRREARAAKRAAEGAAAAPPRPGRPAMVERSDTSVSLERALHDRFKVVCAATGMTQSERLRYLIDADVQAHDAAPARAAEGAAA